MSKFNPKIKAVSFSWNFVSRLIQIQKLNCSVHFFSYRPQRSSLGKFCLKNLNCWFKLKFGTQTNLNVKNSMVMFIFSTFDEFMSFFVVWLTNKTHLALLPAGTIVRYPHYRESLTRCEQDLNLRRSWVEALLNEFMQ